MLRDTVRGTARSGCFGAYFLRTSAHFRCEPGANLPFCCEVCAECGIWLVSLCVNLLTFSGFAPLHSLRRNVLPVQVLFPLCFIAADALQYPFLFACDKPLQ